jgi:hypothetical protein
MKKIFGSLILTLLFAFTFASAQGIVGVKSYNLGTVANTVWEDYRYDTFQGLLKEFGCNKIDSITVSITVKNETDIDTLNWYPVNWTNDGTAVNGTVKTFIVTLNIAAAGTGTETPLITGAGLASSLWRGKEGFGWRTRGAVSGNDVDGSNANSVKVTFTFYGS